MSKLELLYFPIHARALIVRLIFKVGNVDFTDTKMTREEFMASKPTYPLGQLPVLKIDGKMFCQTTAIVNYAAECAGISNLTKEERIKSDMIIETIKQVQDEVTKPAFSARSAVPENEAEKRSTTFYSTLRDSMPGPLAKLEKMLKDVSSSTAVVPGKRSLADMYILNEYIRYTSPKIEAGSIFASGCPSAQKIVNALLADKRIETIVKEQQAIQYWPM